MNYYLDKATDNKHKYTVQFLNQTTKRINTIHFGSANMSDYTLNKDDRRKALYIKRHVNDYINDLNYPGSWSMHLLWNKKTLEESIRDMEKRFKINIINLL